jgi:stage V sporulation protein R
MRLFAHIEELGDKGKFTYEFQRIQDVRHRKGFDSRTGAGMDSIFGVRENFSDFTFLNTFVDQEFVDRHQLFVVGKRLNQAKGVWEYFVQSRDAGKYRQMLLDSLYHPPHVEVDEEKTRDECLYLSHSFEGKPLVREFIESTMIGISFLWGGSVKLETSEAAAKNREPAPYTVASSNEDGEPSYQRVLYTLEDRKLSKVVL